MRLQDITPYNKVELRSFRHNYLNPSSPQYVYRYLPCSALHPAVSACSFVTLERFFSVFQWVLPVYGALHFIPPILFKWTSFLKDPWSVILRAGLGSARSSAFLGVFVIIFQSMSTPCISALALFEMSSASLCYKHRLHRYLTKIKLGLMPSNSATAAFKHIPQSVIDLLISKFSFFLLGILSGLSILVEEKRRRTELTMYVLPKGFESLWIALRGRGLVFRTGDWGEILVRPILI